MFPCEAWNQVKTRLQFLADHPGVGLLTYQSLNNLDLPVIMATVVYGAFFIVLCNTAVDIAYAWLDPRVRPT